MMLNRRTFLRGAALTAGAMAVQPVWANAASNKPAGKKPNIVFILADDMGYGDLNCQNPESKVPTPYLDQMAKDGFRSTNSHSPSSVCTPTRYSILTGRYCWRSRLKRWVLWQWAKPLIEKDRLTVPAMLKKQGYQTACVGKWHLGWNWPTKDGKPLNRRMTGETVDFTKPITGGPLSKGFDYYFGDDVPNFAPYCFIENDRTVGIPTEIKPSSMFGAKGVMLKGWKLDAVMPAITKKAVEYVNQAAKKDKPFFLYFALTAPHTPIAPAKEFRGKTKAGAYGDLVHQVDHSVGQVIQALKAAGVYDNTLVVFTSDNGSPARNGKGMCGPSGSVLKYGHNPNRPWRGMKADSWDGGHRVPFLVTYPGRIPAGQVSDEPICHVDFMATVATMLNITLPENAGEDSYNILPLLEGKACDKPLREAVIHHSGSGMFCVRQGKWKLILGKSSGGFSRWKPPKNAPAGQLYDLQSDPSEKTNLYRKHPDVVQQLTALLKKYQSQGYSRPKK